MARTAGYPRASVVRRERLRRGSLLVAVAILIVLAVSPLLGHHVPVGLEGQLAGRDHLWALCVVALHVILEPFHGLFHLLFIAGVMYGIRDRVRAWLNARRALASLTAVQPTRGDAFWQAAHQAAVDPLRVRVVRALPDPAFTAGWLQPCVYVARELGQHLSHDELVAVLAHEGAHLLRRDPLRLSLLRFIRCTLFWLPALGQLAEDVAEEAEIQADDRAAALDPLVLAAALVKLAAWNTRSILVPEAVAFHRGDLLERRVRRLAGDDVSPRSRVTPGSALAAVAVIGIALASGAAVAHPLPGDDNAAHCEEHGAAALLHLFCLGLNGTRADCPSNAHAHSSPGGAARSSSGADVHSSVHSPRAL